MTALLGHFGLASFGYEGRGGAVFPRGDSYIPICTLRTTSEIQLVKSGIICSVTANRAFMSFCRASTDLTLIFSAFSKIGLPLGDYQFCVTIPDNSLALISVTSNLVRLADALTAQLQHVPLPFLVQLVRHSQVAFGT